MSTSEEHPSEETFTNREVQILRLLAEGDANKQIAQKLFLSPGTVKWYNKRIYRKLGVRNRTQAGIRARETGLFDREREGADTIIPALKGNPPADLTSFVGRQKELAFVGDRLGDPACRLLSVIGALTM